MNSREKIKKALDYIDDHFDDDLSLDQLSDIAGISKYHFHRLFTMMNGLPLHKYIRWLKLKRAANQLLFEKNTSILDIALQTGFESHEAFTRAFKLACGESPRAFRKGSKWLNWTALPYADSPDEEINMKPMIENFLGARLAVVEHRGDPKLIPKTLEKLVTWTIDNKLGQPKAGDVFAIAYDDPKTTAPGQFRYDIGRVVPSDMKLSDEVVERILPAGRVAVATHEGSHSTIDRTIYALYNALFSSDEELADHPCVFCFQNYSREVPESALKTDIYFFLKNTGEQRR